MSRLSKLCDWLFDEASGGTDAQAAACGAAEQALRIVWAEGPQELVNKVEAAILEAGFPYDPNDDDDDEEE